MQEAPYEMGSSDWSSDMCSSVLGVADLLQVAADRLHLQVDGCVAGENQGDRARPRVDGEQVEDLVVVAGLHAAVAHPAHLVEAEAAVYPLERGIVALGEGDILALRLDRKSTRLNSSH